MQAACKIISAEPGIPGTDSKLLTMGHAAPLFQKLSYWNWRLHKWNALCQISSYCHQSYTFYSVPLLIFIFYSILFYFIFSKSEFVQLQYFYVFCSQQDDAVTIYKWYESCNTHSKSYPSRLAPENTRVSK